MNQAIRVANELFPEYNFVHSNFTEYYGEIKKEGLPELSTVKGELRSQETDGWYTLANTASNRIHLKQRSHELSQRLEQVIEPLAVICKREGSPYPTDKIDFAWKLLLQNYPHDSICACSVDEVIQGMEARFDQCEAVLDYLQFELLDYLSQYHFSPKPKEALYPFQVWNTTTIARTSIAKVNIEISRCQFSEESPSKAFEKMEALDFGQWQVVDAQGSIYEAEIIDLGVRYHYDLPKDRFRVPYMARYAQVELIIEELAPLSVMQLYLVPKDVEDTKIELNEGESNINRIENTSLAIEVNDDGTITFTDKQQDIIFEGQCILEDTGDSGNEYIFKESSGERLYSQNQQFSVEKESTPFEQRLIVTYQWELPVSADEQLLEEQRRVIDITNRTSGRSNKRVMQTVNIVYSLKPFDKWINVSISGNNEVKDHRLRMLWQLPNPSSNHLSDSHYEIVTRPNQVSQEWRNPSNPQVSRHAVSIHNGRSNGRHGLTVASKGNYEYEVTSSQLGTVLAVTILRCTGEMGDWGYFPTPEAQCLHGYRSDLKITFWHSTEGEIESLIEGRYLFNDFLTYSPANPLKKETLSRTSKSLLHQLFKQELPNKLEITAIKGARSEETIAIRFINFGKEIEDIRLLLNVGIKLNPVNLIEKSYSNGEEKQKYTLKTDQIQTYLIYWEDLK